MRPQGSGRTFGKRKLGSRAEARRARSAKPLPDKELGQCLIESSVDGILAFDREFRYTLWNPAMEGISGVSKTQALDKCAFHLFPFLKETGGDEFLRAALEGKTVISRDRRYHNPQTGREGIYEEYYSPLRNRRGEIVGGIAIIRDITERRQAEDILRLSEERCRDLVENSGVLIGTHDASGQVLSVNREMVELAGYSSAEQIVGRRIPDFLPQNVRHLFDAYLEEVLRESRARGLVRMTARSGEEKIIEYNNSLRREGLEKPIVRCIGLDVTERKKAERALRESEERFRTMANAAPVMIWMSGPDALCTFFSQPWLDFTGRPLEQQTGNGWAESVHPDDLERCLDSYLRAFQERKNFEMEYRLRRADGEYRWVFDIGVPRFEPHGAFAGYIGSCSDITELKQAEDRLRLVSRRLIKTQDEERQRISRELHDTTASSLTGLIANLALVQRSAAALDARARRALAESLDLARQCASEIRTIAYLLHPPLLNELGLASAVRWYADGFAKRSGVRVDLDLPAQLDRLPRDAETALFRIVQEGLTNIHLHSGSPTARIEIVQRPNEITLTLQDQGCGIPSNLLEGPADDIRGLGVGIAGMRERVRQLGGRMEIRSCKQGTTVKAILPLAEEYA